MVYHMVTQDREGAVLPPCKNCGSNVRFRFDKDYFSKGKLFCSCEKTDFVVGGVRSREGQIIPAEAMIVIKTKMEEYGFKGISIVAADPEKHPSGYKSIIKATGHVSPDVYHDMLNTKKPERSFVATYEYDTVTMEHAPFSNYPSNNWNWVERPQRSNRDLTTGVYRYLTKGMTREAASDFHSKGWKNQVIFKGVNYAEEQARKSLDIINAEKARFRSNVASYGRSIAEHQLAVERLLKQINQAREDFKAAYGEEL
jgi:hypothetical protein